MPGTGTFCIIGGTGCQCPLGLELLLQHRLQSVALFRFNALSGLSCYDAEEQKYVMLFRCQCPLGLIPHFYELKHFDPKMEYPPVSMPSRAYTSFLRYPFKNLSFMRFPEPVFAGIYQNILTTAVFRAC